MNLIRLSDDQLRATIRNNVKPGVAPVIYGNVIKNLMRTLHGMSADGFLLVKLDDDPRYFVQLRVRGTTTYAALTPSSPHRSRIIIVSELFSVVVLGKVDDYYVCRVMNSDGTFGDAVLLQRRSSGSDFEVVRNTRHHFDIEEHTTYASPCWNTFERAVRDFGFSGLDDFKMFGRRIRSKYGVRVRLMTSRMNWQHFNESDHVICIAGENVHKAFGYKSQDKMFAAWKACVPNGVAVVRKGIVMLIVKGILNGPDSISDL